MMAGLIHSPQCLNLMTPASESLLPSRFSHSPVCDNPPGVASAFVPAESSLRSASLSVSGPHAGTSLQPSVVSELSSSLNHI